MRRRDLSVAARTHGNRCAYCHESSPDLEECHGCGALTHRECRALHGSCPTLGCTVPERDPKHRAGRANLLLRIAARAALIALAGTFFFLPVVLPVLRARGLAVTCGLFSLYAIPIFARALYLAVRSLRLLRETPVLMLMTVDDAPDSDNGRKVATFAPTSDPSGRAEVPLALIHAPDWALCSQTDTKVLVYGAGGTGPFVVGMPGFSSLVLVAPIFGARLL